jgi:hypothetical protein
LYYKGRLEFPHLAVRDESTIQFIAALASKGAALFETDVSASCAKRSLPPSSASRTTAELKKMEDTTHGLADSATASGAILGLPFSSRTS